MTANALQHQNLPTEIPACCAATIRKHVQFNPMMVCSACKQIIKCFKQEREFQNFLTFCRGRKRAVLIGMVEDHHTIVFKSFERPLRV
jgi:hypothetical protein